MKVRRDYDQLYLTTENGQFECVACGVTYVSKKSIYIHIEKGECGDSKEIYEFLFKLEQPEEYLNIEPEVELEIKK